jgi:O-antigen ligase
MSWTAIWPASFQVIPMPTRRSMRGAASASGAVRSISLLNGRAFGALPNRRSPSRRLAVGEPFVWRRSVKTAGISPPLGAPNDRTSRSDAVVLLQVFALAVMVIPSNTVIAPVGAAGYPASLIGVFVFVVFSASVLLGFHNPIRHSHPIQGVLCVIWVSVLASYMLMDRGLLTGVELAGADRMLIRFAVVTGVALVAAEWLRSLPDAMRVVRVLCWAGAFCGLVAAIQYWLSFDLAHYLRQLPGFTVNQDDPAILARGSLNRVAGTAITPIELGVVAGMLVPLAVCVGLYDRDKSALKRWAPVTLITLGVATSVSRSAILSVVVAFTVLLVLMPPRPRLGAICALPIVLAGAFMSAHGLIGTIASFFSGASNDPSVQYRTHDYPLAEQLWHSAPWLGHGAGTYIPADPLNIFDNQYLNSAVELGLVGVLALIVFLVFPAIVALAARRWSTTPELRLLCAALAGAGMAGAVCSFTFDSLSFPMFVNVYALVIGLVGACWRLAAAERGHAMGRTQTAALPPMRIEFPLPGRFWPRRAES